jgi:hypothetical protein
MAGTAHATARHNADKTEPTDKVFMAIILEVDLIRQIQKPRQNTLKPVTCPGLIFVFLTERTIGRYKRPAARTMHD